ncbi:hypothetical protein MUG78_16095 [Gordonia alkaliphila]|uniref:Uncharacterized protein n=1 Tax=Gordonia alkaliphila TaxID=1053547 RepID=A0ABP8Z5J8_9ACTN|nr:hypothetical protein [Gordonia alkaliphila]MCK0440932.1 hypothetical protein [Gordonia alkaliphila]
MVANQPNVPDVLAELLSAPPIQQRAFPWKLNKWRGKFHDRSDVVDLLERLPDRVDRETIRQAVHSELADGRVLPAFVAAMVWGYGTSGYGPTRVRWMLTGLQQGAATAPVREDVVDRLRIAAAKVTSSGDDSTSGPVEGFRYLTNEGHIKQLGPAFFTKWLYFASAHTGIESPEAAPILDSLVQQWLADPENAGLILTPYRTPDYTRYLELLRDWGAPFGRTPAQVETAIFELARNA